MARETLRQKQSRFARGVALLILYAEQLGYEVTFGEAWLDAATRDWQVASGKRRLGSLHFDRLAIDLNLFREGRWLTSTESHRPLGEFWEGLGNDYAWGGRFGDGNHYSIEHNGRK